MSLDIYLHGEPETVECVCDCCGNTHQRETSKCLWQTNITHNLTTMAVAAGLHNPMWHPEALKATRAREVIDDLEAGLNNLRAHRELFEQHNPSNGWGDYDGLVRVASNYLDACREHPDATITVSR
jgi:hypothetical protein